MISPLVAQCSRWAVVTLLMLFSGCARNAVFTTFDPGNGPGLGSRRISVLQIEGPPHLAALTEAELNNRLRQVGLYELVAPPKTPQVATASFRSGDGSVVRWSQNRGVDTIVRGRIESGYKRGGEGGIVIGDPTINVSLFVELVDAQQNKVLAHETFVESDRIDTDADPADPGSEPRVIAALTKKCVERATAQLFVQEKSITAELASGGYGYGTGATEIRRGNKLAGASDWLGAKAAYWDALKVNPQSSAAAYNLGIAHEAMHDYGTARNLYKMAADREDHQEYRDADLRVERAMNVQRVAAKLRQGGTEQARILDSKQQPAKSKWAMSAAATLPVRPSPAGHPQARRLPPLD